MMKLIVGKNSSVVCEIKPFLDDFDYISHVDISGADLTKYNFIFIFSWDNNLKKEYYELLSMIPMEKVVFISTTAVFSLNIRPQWNLYPNNKSYVESFILKNGGSIYRLGVWKELEVSKYFGCIPFTSLERLVADLNFWSLSTNKIKNGFDIISIPNNTFLKQTFFYFHQFSLLLPHSIIFQVPLQIVPKFFGFKSYGFTADASMLMHEEVMIGHGVLGSAFKTKTKFRGMTLVSGLNDITLNNNGFVRTKIGYGLIGLSKYWHGVSVYKDLSNRLKKIVPLYVKRIKPRLKFKIFHVDKIFHENKIFRILNLKSGHEFFANKIILAAGPIENIRLLSNLTNFEGVVRLSDHEIGMVGRLPVSDVIAAGYVKDSFGFIYGGILMSGSVLNTQYLLDFRPLVAYKHHSDKTDNSFYLDSTSNIVMKIINQFSFYRLNEAFYNKFGFAIKTNHLSVFIQILYKNCIEYELKSSGELLSRKRFKESEWKCILDDISKKIPGFNPDPYVHSIDGQHICGGKELLALDKIEALTDPGELKILGSPTLIELDEFHHTNKLKNYF